MAKKYRVCLSVDERAVLTELVTAGKAAARAQTHDRLKLKHLYPVTQPARES